jgi:signal transduction histidine kinase
MTREVRFGILAIVVVLLTTAVTILSPAVRFAYRNPGLHLVLETAEALVASLVAFLVFGRFRRSGHQRDLFLTFALGLLSAVNVISVAFALTEGEADSEAWAILVLRLVGAVAFGYAALRSFSDEQRRASVSAGPALAALLGVTAVVIVGVFGVLNLFEGSLPPAVSTPLDAARSVHVVIEGHPLLVTIQGLNFVVFAAAAAGLLAAARRERDDLWMWFGAGAIFAMGARINYLLFPSLYSDYVYTGDALRLAFYVLLLVGAAREIHRYWETYASAALDEQRTSLARELHDGIAQELVFIAAQSKRLERGREPDMERGLSMLSSASERAVAGARRAIRALVKSPDESLAEAVVEVAGDLTRGADLELTLDLDPSVDVSPSVREGLLRIMGEAIRNSIRHSGASGVTVSLVRSEDAICFSILDDGSGFDSEARRDVGFGLVTMEEQARALPGSLRIGSTPGAGTKIEVTLDG